MELIHSYETTIIWLLFFHWVADFLTQTRTIGKNKSKSISALGTHVITYMFMLFALSTIIFQNAEIAGYFVLLNGGLHFITDFFTSRIGKYFYKNSITSKDCEDRWMYLFWANIGIDQFIHTATLIYTLKYFIL